MSFEEVSMQDAFEDLKRDLESGNPITGSAYKVRINKPMYKEEFSQIRREMDFTQAQLAELLDISIKTVQSYEQGRIEPPGLVAKVLRLLRSNSTFKNIFQGNFDLENSSDSAQLLFAQPSGPINGESAQLVQTIQETYEKFQTTIQIHNMTGPSDVMNLNIPQQYEVIDER